VALWALGWVESWVHTSVDLLGRSIAGGNAGCDVPYAGDSCDAILEDTSLEWGKKNPQQTMSNTVMLAITHAAASDHWLLLLPSIIIYTLSFMIHVYSNSNNLNNMILITSSSKLVPVCISRVIQIPVAAYM
jgi:hypothetical protein